MNYKDYLLNAEKHYCYCIKVISIEWEERFANDFRSCVKEKLYNSLKSFDKNRQLDLEYIERLLNSIINRIAFTNDYSSIEPSVTNLFDDLVNQIISYEQFECEEKKIEKKKGTFTRYVENQYEYYRKTLYNICYFKC